MARQYLVKELGDYLPKIKAYTEMATDAQKLMDTDKVTRNQESFLKNKKRMREYTKRICVMESRKFETRKRLKMINNECARRGGRHLESDSESDVSLTGF